MSAAGSRAFSSMYLFSKRALSQHLVETSWTSRRIFHSKSNNLEETVKGSLEFVEWHNGGGLFHKTAIIDPSVFIEVGAIVHQKAIIGADVRIGSGSIVGPSVSIGKSTNIRYNAVLSNCSVGISCVIHNGSCIGQDGFGFFVDEEGNMMKKPQDIHDETIKKRRRATRKPHSRSIFGVSLEVIQKKRTEKPEIRDAAREAALREIKERIKKTKDEKKAKKAEVLAKTQKTQTKGNAPKGGSKGPKLGGGGGKR